MPLRIVHPQEGWNQNQQRSVAIFFDQHRNAEFPDGRPYWCTVENPADPKHAKYPVGELMPISTTMTLSDGSVVTGWDAPWLPEQKYFTMAMSMLTGNRFKLAYDRMIVDYKAASHRYYTNCAREAAARNWPAPKLYGAVSFQLRAILGEPPKSPKVPEAALAGDPWLLGFSKQPNEEIQKILLREKDQMVVTLEEAGLEDMKAQPVSHVAPLGGLTPDEQRELLERLRAQQTTPKRGRPRKQASPSDATAA